MPGWGEHRISSLKPLAYSLWCTPKTLRSQRNYSRSKGTSKVKSPLRILHLEDDPGDAEIVQAFLEGEDIACEISCVQTEDQFVGALEKGRIDLILSDFTLPGFDGLSAARIVRERWPTIPVILVSGTMGEEMAIDSFKSGATDYVLKGRLSRLVPSVRRAMLEVEVRAERRELEAQFIQAQKMEVIGQLAGGVAHDLSNILSVVMGCSDLITARLGPNSPVAEFTEEIRYAISRGVGLTRQLLVLSRKQTMPPVSLDLNETLKEMEKMLRRLLEDNIEMAIVPGEQTGRVKADPGYIGQVLMNLVVNARDAMPDGGKLTISTENITLNETDALEHGCLIPGEYVMLCVSDTGIGMNDETKLRLFEAFYTTKPDGKGAGLGLATCRTIVKQSGGHIEVESELGIGTRFRVYFPRDAQQPEGADELISSERLPSGKKMASSLEDRSPTSLKFPRRILVVDDDVAVRRLTTDILVRYGYQVDAAANGATGWQALQAKRYDLLITDNSMPKVTGVEMVAMVHNARMPVPVIMAVGNLPKGEFTQHPWFQAVSTLLKPFTVNELLRAVKNSLQTGDDAREELGE
jgi:two-component system cell cycle sensor histidine kinase/response regulator CckA